MGWHKTTLTWGEADDKPRVFQLAWALLHGSAAILAAMAVVGHTASALYHLRRA